MVTHDLPKYRYRIDADDAIVWVDAWWQAFARENGAPELAQESILGRSLWDFVAGDDTRELYQDIHARVRTNGRPAVLVFRCDSPSLRRDMRLKITREEGDLLYESVLIRAQLQRHLSVFDLQQPRSDSILTICSACRRGLLEPSGWLEVEDISNRLRLFERRELPGLRYSICPTCAEIMRVAST